MANTSADRPCVLPEFRWQPGAAAARKLIHQHDRTNPADSHGRKPGRRRVRSVGFWIRLDILSDQLRRRSSAATETRQSSDLEQRHWRQRGVQRQVGYENGETFVVVWHVSNVTNLIISTESSQVRTSRCDTQRMRAA